MSNIQDAIILSVTSMKKYTDKKHGGGVKTYETLQVLKEDLNLKIGDKCHSLGYYSIGDGGNSLYKIRDKSDSDVDDGGSVIFLNNGLVASLIVENNTINVKQFGAKGDGSTDDTVAIQSAIDASKDWYTIYVPAGIYIISAGLTMEKRRTLRGDSYCRDDCSPFGASVISVKKGVSNITAFKIVQRRGTETTNPGWNENRSAIINMTFIGNSCHMENNTEGTEVGDKYKLVFDTENVNGIDMNRSSHLCNMENVSVNNFSGTGIILGGCSVNRHLAAFGCNVGIDVSTDSMASHIYVWGCNYGIIPSIGCCVDSGRVEEICKHAIYVDRVTTGAQIRNLTLDQIGYSAIEVTDNGVLTSCTIDVKMSRCCQYYYGLNCEDLMDLPEDERILAAFGEFHVSPKGQLSVCTITAFCDNAKISLNDTVSDSYSKFFIVNESTSWWGDTTNGGIKFKSNHFKLNEIFSGETYVGADMFQALLDNHYFYTTTDNNKFGVFTLQNDFEQCMVYGSPWSSAVSKVIRYYTFNKVNIS